MRGMMVALVLCAAPAAADPKLAKVHDCIKEPTAKIPNGKGNYAFKGQCTSIKVSGGENTLTIESVDTLEVTGSKNTIEATTVGSIRVTGSTNTITWKKAKTGDKPGLKGQLDKNTITQAK